MDYRREDLTMSTGLQSAYRLKVRVGQAEFEAEGPEETVKDQFDLFLRAIEGTHRSNGEKKNAFLPEKNGHSDDVLREMWEQFYIMEGDEDVSLKVLPRTENASADAILLLMYGYLVLRNKDVIGAANLLAMGKKSGLRIDRIDRSMPDEYSRYYGKRGNRRGCCYSLNNQGKAFAQELLEAEAER
jgi:hypothetical protein